MAPKERSMAEGKTPKRERVWHGNVPPRDGEGDGVLGVDGEGLVLGYLRVLLVLVMRERERCLHALSCSEMAPLMAFYTH